MKEIISLLINLAFTPYLVQIYVKYFSSNKNEKVNLSDITAKFGDVILYSTPFRIVFTRYENTSSTFHLTLAFTH